MTIGSRLFLGALLSVAAVAALGVAFGLYLEDSEHRIFIAAGPHEEDPFVFAQAIAEVTERYYPELIVDVVETAGSRENIRLLEEGKVELATILADTETQRSARLVALLYPDVFQLIARDDSDIERVPDLKGRRIALPPTGSGQYASFWPLAEHYGLSTTDLQALPMSIDAANWALHAGAVDAVFRVRAPGNAAVLDLIEGTPTHLIPIAQAAAMHLKQPALDEGSIPRGVYRGDPPLPRGDLPSVQVKRLLVAHEAVDERLITIITRVLFERRRELLSLTPLAGFTKSPEYDRGTFVPVHPGAQRFFDREKPSYLAENAELFAFVLSAALVLGSSLLAFRGWWQRSQKDRVDHYNQDLVQLCRDVQSQPAGAQDHHHRELLRILARVVDDLDRDRVTREGFDTFAFTWQAASSLITARPRSGDGPAGAPTERRD